jgi:hypothetical protein
MSPKNLKVLGTVYLVKCLLILTACIAIPDLPHRAMATIRATWSRLAP